MNLENLLDESAKSHHHLCPRQILGVRIGMYASELFGLELPQSDKRLFCFVETDGCLIDGVVVATGCSLGRRAMYLMDYRKTAVTFVDTETQRAFRITPTIASRQRALEYAPNAPDRWHAQWDAYQIMPSHELLHMQEVKLTIDLTAIISKHGMRVVCQQCGEDVINERFVNRDRRLLCRPCADGAYYVTEAIAMTLPRRMPAAASL